jgi:hypothetical protein
MKVPRLMIIHPPVGQFMMRLRCALGGCSGKIDDMVSIGSTSAAKSATSPLRSMRSIRVLIGIRGSASFSLKRDINIVANPWYIH